MAARVARKGVSSPRNTASSISEVRRRDSSIENRSWGLLQSESTSPWKAKSSPRSPVSTTQNWSRWNIMSKCSSSEISSPPTGILSPKLSTNAGRRRCTTRGNISSRDPEGLCPYHVFSMLWSASRSWRLERHLFIIYVLRGSCLVRQGPCETFALQFQDAILSSGLNLFTLLQHWYASDCRGLVSRLISFRTFLFTNHLQSLGNNFDGIVCISQIPLIGSPGKESCKDQQHRL